MTPDPKLVEIMLAVRVAGIAPRELVALSSEERSALVAAGWQLERIRADLIAEAIARKLGPVAPPAPRDPIDAGAELLRAALDRHVEDATE